MSPLRTITVLLIMSAALTACGCFGGGDGNVSSRGSGGNRFFKKKDGATASRSGGRGRKGAKNARANDGKIEDLSPENSMKRDLAVLRDRERAQVKVVKDMRGALVEGEDVVIREEQKLDEIRNQIARYDMAINDRGYAGARNARGGRAAARPAPSGGNVMPASMYTDEDNGGGRSRYADRHDPAPRRGRVEPASYRTGEREERAPARGPARRPAYESNDDGPYSSRDRGAPSRYDSRPSREEPARGGREEWSPDGNLFSSADSGFAVRRAPAGGNALRPEPLRRAAPRQEVEEPQRVSVPAAGASVRPRKPAQQPEPPARSESMDEEVFTPDLYLSGGR